MTVYVRAVGRMKEHLGSERHEVQLPAGSHLQDLLDYIDSRWGRELPVYLWNRKERRFRSPVVCMIEKRAVKDPGMLLQDRQEVCLHQVLVGG